MDVKGCVWQLGGSEEEDGEETVDPARCTRMDQVVSVSVSAQAALDCGEGEGMRRISDVGQFEVVAMRRTPWAT